MTTNAKKEQEAFNAWWDELTTQGDPMRIPNLARTAFRAGYRAAQVEDQTNERGR